VRQPTFLITIIRHHDNTLKGIEFLINGIQIIKNNKTVTLKEFLNKQDRFANSSGIQLTEIRPGYAKAEMDVEERHLNGGNVCQGGVYFTLADLAIAAVANTSGKLTLGIQNSIAFVKSAYKGDHLTAEATEVVPAYKVPYMEVRVTNQNGDICAIVTGLGYRKKEDVVFQGLQ